MKRGKSEKKVNNSIKLMSILYTRVSSSHFSCHFFFFIFLLLLLLLYACSRTYTNKYRKIKHAINIYILFKQKQIMKKKSRKKNRAREYNNKLEI